jgi:hypothetical protein
VQFKNQWDDPNWTDVAPDVPATDPTATLTNNLNGATQGFYRVLLLP